MVSKVFLMSMILVGFFFSAIVRAEPLGTVPTIEDSALRFIGEFGSDLWTSPTRDKRSPIRMYRAKFRVPVKKDEFKTASLQLEADGLSLGRSDITLGKHQVYLGTDFRDQKVGFGFDQHFEDGSSFTLFGAYESASDQPFESGRDSWMEGIAIYRWAKVDTSQWILLVNHTKNRGFLNGVAFPYFGLSYDLSETTQIIFGFPFLRINWVNPYEWVSGFVVTPVMARMEMHRTFAERYAWEILAGFSVRSYLHANRIEDDERIFSEHKFIETGFKTDLSPTTSIRFSLGGSFDRRIYEAKSIFRNDQSAVYLPADVYSRLGVELRL